MCQSHLLIGAASSGSGKTTFTLGLLRALKNRSFKVQPFKCGPDYIDTRHHRMAAGNPSVNLDLFMMSEAHVRDLYAGYTEKADVAVTEGMMGLFDGYDGMKGSCAEIACMLKIPVVLIVNAKSTAYSVAPLLYGFKQFNKQVQIVGAVFNFVASELTIPIIGIGAGGGVDGQVLVMHDMLGINQGFSPRFLRRYANLAEEITRAVQAYIEDVKTLDFPNEKEQY